MLGKERKVRNRPEVRKVELGSSLCHSMDGKTAAPLIMPEQNPGPRKPYKSNCKNIAESCIKSLCRICVE